MRVISLDEKEFNEILSQGIPHKQLFFDSEWETNAKIFNSLKGAVLISAFVQAEKVRLFFRTPDGKVLRLKIHLHTPLFTS